MEGLEEKDEGISQKVEGKNQRERKWRENIK